MYFENEEEDSMHYDGKRSLKANEPWRTAARLCKLGYWLVFVLTVLVCLVGFFAMADSKLYGPGPAICFVISTLLGGVLSAMFYYGLFAFFSWQVRQIQDNASKNDILFQILKRLESFERQQRVAIKNSHESSSHSVEQGMCCSMCGTLFTDEDALNGKITNVNGKLFCTDCLNYGGSR